MPRRRMSSQFRHFDPFASYSDLELEHVGEGWSVTDTDPRSLSRTPHNLTLPTSITTRGILHTPGGGINVTGNWRAHAFDDTIEGMGDNPADWEAVMGRLWDDFTVSPLLEVPQELVGEHRRREEHSPTSRPRMHASVQQRDTSQVPRWSDPGSMVQAFGVDPGLEMNITGKPPPPASPHGQTYSEGYWHEPPLNPSTLLLPEDTDMSSIGSFKGEHTPDSLREWTPDRAKGILTWDEDPAASIFEGISSLGNTTMDVVADPKVLRYRQRHNDPSFKEQASSAREVTPGPNFVTAIDTAYQYVAEEHQRYLASLRGDYFDQGTGAQDFGEDETPVEADPEGRKRPFDWEKDAPELIDTDPHGFDKLMPYSKIIDELSTRVPDVTYPASKVGKWLTASGSKPQKGGNRPNIPGTLAGWLERTGGPKRLFPSPVTPADWRHQKPNQNSLWDREEVAKWFDDAGMPIVEENAVEENRKKHEDRARRRREA